MLALILHISMRSARWRMDRLNNRRITFWQPAAMQRLLEQVKVLLKKHNILGGGGSLSLYNLVSDLECVQVTRCLGFALIW